MCVYQIIDPFIYTILVGVPYHSHENISNSFTKRAAFTHAHIETDAILSKWVFHIGYQCDNLSAHTHTPILHWTRKRTTHTSHRLKFRNKSKLTAHRVFAPRNGTHKNYEIWSIWKYDLNPLISMYEHFRRGWKQHGACTSKEAKKEFWKIPISLQIYCVFLYISIYSAGVRTAHRAQFIEQMLSGILL